MLLLGLLLSSCISQINTTVLTVQSWCSDTGCAHRGDADHSLSLADQWDRMVRGGHLQDYCSGAASVALHIDLAGTGAVVCAALALYWLLPSWRRHRRCLVPAADFEFELRPEAAAPAQQRRPPMIWTAEEWRLRHPAEERAPESGPRESLTEHLSRLVVQTGLRRPPGFVVDAGASSAGAVAFGRGGRHSVCLDGNLVMRRDRQPKMFEAVVLHELAHIRNGDVDIAYVVVALWRIYLPVVLLPCQLVTCWALLKGLLWGTERGCSPEAELRSGMAALSLSLAALTYLALADILRRRELVADLDAVAFGADPVMWRMAREGDMAGRRSGGSRWLWAAGRWFCGLWRIHPTWDQRYRTLVRSEIVDSGGTPLQFLLYAGAAVMIPYALAPVLLVAPAWLGRAIAANSVVLAASAFEMIVCARQVIPRFGLRIPARGDGWILRYTTMSISWRLGLIAVYLVVLVVVAQFG
ncbi:M48 family metalloprotease [Kitasatospora sp. A2-31]|uniref:M48 family metalloprotease n=1 Tax=Kitasatospora sp. A2-31 TaxID=2916414 RepID=UPI001EE9D93C|nr:M48 family metalloprotease [Kitasatospora sp. A2-31]MCG6494051.1 M48 family metalloprotease [Kitasatospora sp. A2-31]